MQRLLLDKWKEGFMKAADAEGVDPGPILKELFKEAQQPNVAGDSVAQLLEMLGGNPGMSPQVAGGVKELLNKMKGM